MARLFRLSGLWTAISVGREIRASGNLRADHRPRGRGVRVSKNYESEIRTRRARGVPRLLQVVDRVQDKVSDARWHAVSERDPSATGVFVYGVTTTRIYCRPSCSSRRPLRDHTVFFATPAEARENGFRACRRCQPDTPTVEDGSLAAVIAVCRHLENPRDDRSAAAVAAEFGYGERHFRRRFVETVGVPVGTYARAQRARRSREALRTGDSVARAIVESSYGSFSAFYESAATTLGMSPGRYLDGGGGERITYTSLVTPLGVVLVGCTARGVCAVHLGDDETVLEATLRTEFPRADIERDDEGLLEVATLLAGAAQGTRDAVRLPLDVAGTAFQVRVWHALRSIPRGETRTYSEVAAAIGAPSAFRAVASACAANGVALVIPCHRVVRRDGSPGGYRWGATTKVALLAIEATAPPVTSDVTREG